MQEIRDINFSALGPLLHTKAKAIDKDYAVHHKQCSYGFLSSNFWLCLANFLQESKKAKSIPEIKKFVARLGALQQEHRSLQIRTFLLKPFHQGMFAHWPLADTNIAERILQITRENDFRKRLEFEHRTVPPFGLAHNGVS